MAPYARNQGTTSSPSRFWNPSSTPNWRCDDHRLHRGDEACESSKPSSSKIKTPASEVAFEKRQTPADLDVDAVLDSQATGLTEPTPSRPAGASRPLPQDRARAHSGISEVAVTSPANQQDNHVHWVAPRAPSPMVLVSPAPSHTHLATIQEDSPDTQVLPGDEPPVWSQNEFNDNEGFQATDSPPYEHQQMLSSSQRIPESPLDLPSSPPVPRPLLTADNLSQLNRDQPSSSNHSRPSASGAGGDNAHGVAASIRSLPSHAAHQITRLVLRSRINALQHGASQSQLAVIQEDLAAAQVTTHLEAARVQAWRSVFFALLLLCLVYAAWCQYNSADFEFIDECRRAWYGL